MTRPIKFRAWSQYSKGMFYPSVGWELYEGELVSEPDITLMQFTGLYDRNGVPIYEDDITQYGEVVFVEQNASFRINPSTKNKDISFTESFRNYDDIEVIGNVHQNPQLLKQ